MDTTATSHDIRYVRAGEAHIQTLVRLRIAFMIDLFGPQPRDVIDRQTEALKTQFDKCIRNGSYIGWLAFADKDAIACGGMAIREQPGSLVNIPGRTGYLMNMYTVPAHRGLGVCSTLVNKLVDSAKELGIFHFELHATEAGARVYQKLGFHLHHEPTLRRNDAQ